MNPLTIILRYPWHAGAALAAVALLAWGAIGHMQTTRARAELAHVKQVNAEAWRRQAELAARAERLAREAEHSVNSAIERIAKDADDQVQQARAAGADAAAVRLREHLARLTASQRCPAAPSLLASTSTRQSGVDALDVLAQLLDRHSSELVAVGQYADQLRAAGVACERAWDSARSTLNNAPG